MPHAHISLITLGVSDLRRMARFYESLGFVRKMKAAGDDVAFFDAGGVALSLFESEKLAADAALAPETTLPAFRGISLAWNCDTEADVDKVLAAATSAGGKLLKPAQKAFWGGYHGYFADPEGHLWEVAHNPHFPLSPDGKPTLPD
jgi:catechol 2,3-dioxygenase-like lactoylglutathione lyase family enzyme